MTDHPKSSVEKEIMDNALRRIPAPVAVIGARKGDVLGGLTAAWVTRVSIDPVLILVSIGHERYTYELMKGAAHFTVSILAEDQVPAARLFGLRSRREVDKWTQVEYDLLGEGIPAVRDCAARFLCKVQDVFRTGDHDCFVGEVVTAETPSDRPALPMRGADYAPDGR